MKNITISPSITDRDCKSLQIYLSELNKIKVLTKEEEKNLFTQYKQGDLSQRDKLITHNLRFVVSIAKHYQNQGILLEDLIEEGNIGLIRQIDKYDPDKDLKFITYQVWWIKQQMMECLSLHSRIVRIPQNRILELDRVYKFIEVFEQENEYPPTIYQIAEHMNIESSILFMFLELDKRTLYLFDPIYEGNCLMDSM